MMFFVTLVNTFLNRQFLQIFGRFARKSVETIRSQKKLLTNDTNNSILDVAGVPDTPLPVL